MTKDTQLLQEAYANIFEKKKASNGWVPPWIKNSKKEEDTKECKTCEKLGKGKKCKKCSVPKKEKKGALEEAYMSILESKHINKKFARRYNKITAMLLKAEPSSKEYTKLKAERDDLVSILKDHGKTPADLDELLTKKEPNEEIEETEENEPNLQYNDVCTRCGDAHSTEECPENC